RILYGQVFKPMTMTFMCNNTNTSTIRIAKNHSFAYLDYIIYDVARKNCIYTNYSQNLNNRIESCVFNNTNFNLILRELVWQDKGYYTAWDDQGLHLDSLLVRITDNNTSIQPGTSTPDSASLNSGHEKPSVHLVSSIVVVLVAAVIAIVTVRKIRQNKLPKTTTNNLTDRNGNPNTADSSRKRHFEEANSPKTTALCLTKINNSDDPTDFTNNKSHTKVKHYYTRGIKSKSPTTANNKLEMHSCGSLAKHFQSETNHEYNSTNKYGKLKTEIHLDKSHLNSTKTITDPSFEYDYVVQGTWMTSRAPTPDPIATKQCKVIVMTDDSNNVWHKNEDPSTLYVNVSQKRTKTHFTDSRDEQESLDLNIERIAASSFIEVKSAVSADFKRRGVPQNLDYELARNVSDDSSAFEI
ncbi:hypothetical protein ACJMK2_024895, partial [Sinanodonta woodiana]